MIVWWLGTFMMTEMMNKELNFDVIFITHSIDSIDP